MEDNYIFKDDDMDDNKDQLTSAISSILGEMTINERLDILVDRLDDCMEVKYGKQNLQEAIDILLQEIAEGRIDRDTVANLNFEAIFSGSMDEKEERLIQLSLIYTAIAQYSLNNNMIMKAWRAMVDAKHYLSYFSGLKDSTSSNKIERARKGGNKKAQNTTLFKQALIALLKEKRPKQGWRNPISAATVIAPELIEIAEKEDIPVPHNKDDLIHKIINLINEDKEVSQAFN